MAFAIGIGLNVSFVVIEALYGFLGNSVALLADAGHNLSDVLGLGVAWLASELVKRTPTPRFSYGLRSSSILAALFNAVFLLVTVGAISLEAIQRLGSPAPVAGRTVMIVAAIGIAVNGITAWLFASGGKNDINLRGAFLHMASDALVSAGVVLAGLVILLTGWLWLDPVVSLIINALIIWGTWGLLRESLAMSMAAAPAHIDPVRSRVSATRGRRDDPRSAHLVDEHHRDRADLPSGDAHRPSRRRLAARSRGRTRQNVPDQPFHGADRDRSAPRLRSRAGRRGVRFISARSC